MAQAETKSEEKVKKRTGAVKKAPTEKKRSQSTNPLSTYLRETRGEMRKVTWPTREDAQRLTIIVLIVTALFSAFLGALDFLWSNTLEYIIRFLIGQV